MKKIFKEKKNWIVISVILIVLVIVGAYYLNTKQNQGRGSLSAKCEERLSVYIEKKKLNVGVKDIGFLRGILLGGYPDLTKGPDSKMILDCALDGLGYEPDDPRETIPVIPTSRPDEMKYKIPKGWKVYRDDKNNITFNYPSEYIVKPDDTFNGIRILSENALKNISLPSDKYFSMSIVFVPKNSNVSLDDNIKFLAESTRRNTVETKTKFELELEEKRVNIIINSFKPYKIGLLSGMIGDTNNFENPNVTFITKVDNNIYEFYLYGFATGASPTEKNIKIFNQILSTFKFTE